MLEGPGVWELAHQPELHVSEGAGVYLAAEPVVFWNSWHTPVFNLDLVALPRARVTR